MHRRAWLGSRRLVGLVLAVTLAPSILLVILGWRLFREDRNEEWRTLRERREFAAQRVGSVLERALHRVETQLGQPADEDLLSEIAKVPDAALVTVRDGVVDVRPTGRLAYLPYQPTDAVDVDNALIAGELLEFKDRNSKKAIRWYRHVASHSTSEIKAGALLRLARLLRQTGAVDEALATYDALIQLAPTAVEGVPTPLLGRWMRCDLLATLQRHSELSREAAALLTDLRRSGWPIARAAYEVQLTDATRWMGASPSAPTPAESLASTVDDVVRRSQGAAMNGVAHEGRRLVSTEDGAGAVVVRTEPSRIIAFVALPSYVQREWLTPARRGLDDQHLFVALEDPSRRIVDKSLEQLRASDSGLPWTITVGSDDDDAQLARLRERRNLWLVGFAALAALILAGTAVAARAVWTELAVARLQSDFVSAVSHEFRTPLTSLRHIGEVLHEERVTTEERRKDYYGALVRQTNRLQRLVEALLDFGRMEAGATQYRRELVAIDQLVEAVVREFSDDAAAHDEHARIHVNCTETVALADREALSNAVRNLIDNAIKYSPSNPEVWVETRVENDAVAIRVRDRGMGIPAREQHEIFRKFTRGARATSERIKGTGIGLAIVQHVVAGHGGGVTVESELGVGSTFTIWLPALVTPRSARELTDHTGALPSGPPMGRPS